jgi:FixJ family two-component response regulator
VPEAATVYIVDDDAMFARGLSRLVVAAGWDTKVFARADEFLARVDGDTTGCVLLDVRMPGMKGPELHRAMVDRGVALPVVFLTGHGDVRTSVEAMKLGAVDFLEKPVQRERLVAAIGEAIARGARERERRLEAAAARARVDSLSRREREVLTHVIGGRLNKQIAADLRISLKTVKAHRANVMRKMDAGSVAELVALCRLGGVAAHVPHG